MPEPVSNPLPLPALIVSPLTASSSSPPPLAALTVPIGTQAVSTPLAASSSSPPPHAALTVPIGTQAVSTPLAASSSSPPPLVALTVPIGTQAMSSPFTLSSSNPPPYVVVTRSRSRSRHTFTLSSSNPPPHVALDESIQAMSTPLAVALALLAALRLFSFVRSSSRTHRTAAQRRRRPDVSRDRAKSHRSLVEHGVTIAELWLLPAWQPWQRTARRDWKLTACGVLVRLGMRLLMWHVLPPAVYLASLYAYWGDLGFWERLGGGVVGVGSAYGLLSAALLLAVQPSAFLVDLPASYQAHGTEASEAIAAAAWADVSWAEDGSDDSSEEGRGGTGHAGVPWFANSYVPLEFSSTFGSINGNTCGGTYGDTYSSTCGGACGGTYSSSTYGPSGRASKLKGSGSSLHVGVQRGASHGSASSSLPRRGEWERGWEAHAEAISRLEAELSTGLFAGARGVLLYSSSPGVIAAVWLAAACGSRHGAYLVIDPPGTRSPTHSPSRSPTLSTTSSPTSSPLPPPSRLPPPRRALHHASALRLLQLRREHGGHATKREADANSGSDSARAARRRGRRGTSTSGTDERKMSWLLATGVAVDSFGFAALAASLHTPSPPPLPLAAGWTLAALSAVSSMAAIGHWSGGAGGGLRAALALLAGGSLLVYLVGSVMPALPDRLFAAIAAGVVLTAVVCTLTCLYTLRDSVLCPLSFGGGLSIRWLTPRLLRLSIVTSVALALMSLIDWAVVPDAHGSTHGARWCQGTWVSSLFCPTNQTWNK